VALDDALEVARTGTRVRVRGIETANRRVEQVAPGTRVALNLTGVERAELTRGDALVRAAQWTAATLVDVAVTPAPDAVVPLRARLQAHVGSGEHAVSFRVLDDNGLFARLRFAAPLPLAPGDRVVLRDPGRECTLAGGEVLDVEPPSDTRARAAERLASPLGARLLAGRPRVLVTDVPRLTGLSDHASGALVAELTASGVAVRVDDALVGFQLISALRERAHDLVLASDGIELATLASMLHADPRELRAAIAGDDGVTVERGIARATDRAPRWQSPEAAALVARLDASPFAPPEPEDVSLARALVRDGVLVDVGGIVFTGSAVDRAHELVREHLARHGTLGVGDARDLLGSSRKYVVPLLEHFDREGVTRRRGDVRIAGPSIDRSRVERQP
jgi:selenocysteine-specific elongation factor